MKPTLSTAISWFLLTCNWLLSCTLKNLFWSIHWHIPCQRPYRNSGRLQFQYFYILTMHNKSRFLQLVHLWFFTGAVLTLSFLSLSISIVIKDCTLNSFHLLFLRLNRAPEFPQHILSLCQCPFIWIFSSFNILHFQTKVNVTRQNLKVFNGTNCWGNSCSAEVN